MKITIVFVTEAKKKTRVEDPHLYVAASQIGPTRPATTVPAELARTVITKQGPLLGNETDVYMRTLPKKKTLTRGRNHAAPIAEHGVSRFHPREIASKVRRRYWMTHGVSSDPKAGLADTSS